MPHGLVSACDLTLTLTLTVIVIVTLTLTLILTLNVTVALTLTQILTLTAPAELNWWSLACSALVLQPCCHSNMATMFLTYFLLSTQFLL
jgi:hypothetical protein